MFDSLVVIEEILLKAFLRLNAEARVTAELAYLLHN